jgi:hypothetical protein
MVSEPTKTCPQCAETVKAAAKICRFCRYEFPPESQRTDGPLMASHAERRKTMTAGRVQLYCIVFGLCIAAFIKIAGGSWLTSLFIGLLIGGAFYPAWLRIAADEKFLDRGDWPNK